MLEKYEKGVLTGHELVVRYLNGITEVAVRDDIDLTPSSIIVIITEYLNSYQVGVMRTLYGPTPTYSQVQIARKLLGKGTVISGVIVSNRKST